MLDELDIRNFAIIDQLHLRFQSGLTVLTGETGAGKSILIDAVGALIGLGTLHQRWRRQQGRGLS